MTIDEMKRIYFKFLNEVRNKQMITIKTIWNFCDRRQTEIMRADDRIDDKQKGKIIAYQAVQRIINGKVTKLFIWGKKYEPKK